jgi:tRNA A37 threonylcarbamoyladenosine synthetase subunit TsaC/SUA5/YrdC
VRRIADIDPRLRANVDIVLDGGELPGVPSTVLDLAEYEAGGRFQVLREGAVSRELLDRML